MSVAPRQMIVMPKRKEPELTPAEPVQMDPLKRETPGELSPPGAGLDLSKSLAAALLCTGWH